MSENTRLGPFEDDDLPHVTSLQQGPQVRPYYSSAPVTDVRAHDVPLHSVVGGYELQKQHEILNFSLLRTSVMLCHHHITPLLYEWTPLLWNPPNLSLFFNSSRRELNPCLTALSCFKAIVHKWRLWSNVKMLIIYYWKGLERSSLTMLWFKGVRTVNVSEQALKGMCKQSQQWDSECFLFLVFNCCGKCDWCCMKNVNV